MTAVAYPTRELAWVTSGTAALVAALGRLTDAALDEPTALAGWTRRHLLAHLASNAEALGRLLTWARTGVEHPMYASPAHRAADIDAGAALPAGALRARVADTADALAGALATLPAAAWDAPVVTVQGRTIAAREVPWLRTREVWVHAVDLAAGLGFADVPPDVLAALVGDVAAWRRRSAPVPVTVRTPDLTVDLGTDPGAEPVTAVDLPLADAAAWLTGRATRPDRPALTPWI